MTRRKILDEEKREAISISVPKAVKQAAIDSGNASRFFDQAAVAIMEKEARRNRKKQGENAATNLAETLFVERGFFPSEDVAMDGWRTVRAGELASWRAGAGRG